MSTQSVLSVTLGCPGAGKTYCRVRWLVTDYLINNQGLYITNIPLNVDNIAEDVSKQLNVPFADVVSRLVVIPDEVLLSWEKLNGLTNGQLKEFDNKNFPPTQFFQKYDLSGAHISIDEFHKYFGKKTPRALRALWNDWFAEIRKTGCVFEAITQNYAQLNSEYVDKCATRTELVNHSNLKDPIFYIQMGDWYELRAGLFKKTTVQKVTVRETMQACSDSGRLKWIPTGKNESFFITPEYFRYYDSFRNSTGTSGKVITPHEKYGRKILFWFFRRHYIALSSRFILLGLFLWFTLGGGFSFVLTRFIKIAEYSATQNSVDVIKKDPGKDPGNDPGKDPGNDPGKDPVKDPGKYPVKDPGKDPVKDPGKDPVKSEDLFPVLFMEDFVYLKNGYRIKKGDILNGMSVIEVNRAGRYFVLSDGSRYSM